uniref:Thioredoxin domain-containing protein n=1 Tax=Phaeomonas parva TaxID=124430 RepID=A0A6U4DCU0_9STRA|mmetsp:Transcript_16621/g.51047  ORF Transcript_16621/g.51047 Transcript_16621/m.51047 type:complete len:347 (+) Transcript_16621:110-1150(+)
MPVHEVQGLNDFHTQLRNPKKLVVSYFGAHWCGPCKMYGPMFDAMAGQNPQAHFIKVYEDANRDVIAEQGVRAYPTTKIFVEGTVKGEVRGANAPEVQRIVQELQGSMFHAFGGSGATLGGGGATASAEDARAARLKRFAAPAKPNPWLDAAPATTPIESGDAKMDVCGPDGCPPEAGSNPPDILAEDDELQAAIAMSMSDAAETGDSGEAKEGGEAAMDEEDTELTQGVGKLLLEMGFNEVRSRKALRSAGAGADLDACVNWLMEHQDDEDIDDPATLPPKPMPKKELTPAERAAKMEAVQKRMAERRREREEAEKAADINRESDRRQMGKDMQVGANPNPNPYP